MRRLTKHLTPALAAVALLGTAGAAAAAPNLVPVIDNDPASTNPLAVHNWFVETTAAPYSAHYFYGATVSNTSPTDALELKAKPASTVGDTAVAQQVIGGTATDITDTTKVAIKSIGTPNVGFTNWGASNVFSIALTPSGGTAIPSARNAFCWASTSFPAPVCNTTTPNGLIADGVDMGISAAESDSVAVGTTDAYFDITGATPGAATVVERVNPTGAIDEGGATGDNATPAIPVDIPGVTAQNSAASTQAGKAVAVPLKAGIVAPDVLGVKSGGTPPGAKADGNLAYTAANGAHGTVTVSGATATYTPAAGFTGSDSFTFTATDSRGLRGTGTATVTVTAATTPTTPTSPKPPTTTPKPPKNPSSGGTPHFTLSAGQLLINQRIGQAAIRRLNAVAAKLDGRPAPTSKPHKGGTVHLTAAQLLINQRIFQAAVRRAATLEARLDHKPTPHFGPGKGGTVHLTVGQLAINQRIAQAAVRRANALVARAGL